MLVAVTYAFRCVVLFVQPPTMSVHHGEQSWHIRKREFVLIMQGSINIRLSEAFGSLWL
jgi:hypothetical protein